MFVSVQLQYRPQK